MLIDPNKTTLAEVRQMIDVIGDTISEWYYLKLLMEMLLGIVEVDDGNLTLRCVHQSHVMHTCACCHAYGDVVCGCHRCPIYSALQKHHCYTHPVYKDLVRNLTYREFDDALVCVNQIINWLIELEGELSCLTSRTTSEIPE